MCKKETQISSRYQIFMKFQVREKKKSAVYNREKCSQKFMKTFLRRLTYFFDT